MDNQTLESNVIINPYTIEFKKLEEIVLKQEPNNIKYIYVLAERCVRGDGAQINIEKAVKYLKMILKIFEDYKNKTENHENEAENYKNNKIFADAIHLLAYVYENNPIVRLQNSANYMKFYRIAAELQNPKALQRLCNEDVDEKTKISYMQQTLFELEKRIETFGDPYDMNEYAKIIQKENPGKSLEYTKMSASLDNVDGLTAFSQMIYNRDGNLDSPETIHVERVGELTPRKCIERASARGNLDAMNIMAEILVKEGNYEEAIKILMVASRRKHIKSMFDLAKIELNNPKALNKKQQLENLAYIIKFGKPDAADEARLLLAEYYIKTNNIKSADQYYTDIEANSNNIDMLFEALKHLKSKTNCDFNREDRITKLYQKMVKIDVDYKDIALEYSLRLLNGQGTYNREPDVKQGILYLEQSIKAGNLKAAAIYSIMLEKGHLVGKNPNEAEKYRQIATKGGFNDFDSAKNILKIKEINNNFGKVVVRHQMLFPNKVNAESLKKAIMLLDSNNRDEEMAAEEYVQKCIDKGFHQALVPHAFHLYDKEGGTEEVFNLFKKKLPKWDLQMLLICVLFY